MFIMIALVIIISFAFLILTESDDEKHDDDDQSDIDSETVEEIYETADQLRTEEDCFGPEATNSLATFNKKDWGGEESESESEDDTHESQHIKEYLPDILLLVKMPYSRACDMLERYKSDKIQFYGFHQETPKRSRSQSL